jgi:hypothetical protein
VRIWIRIEILVDVASPADFGKTSPPRGGSSVTASTAFLLDVSAPVRERCVDSLVIDSDDCHVRRHMRHHHFDHRSRRLVAQMMMASAVVGRDRVMRVSDIGVADRRGWHTPTCWLGWPCRRCGMRARHHS